MSDEKTTRTLEHELIQVDDRKSLNEYLQSVDKTTVHTSFSEYFFNLDKVKQMSGKEMRDLSGLDRTYFYHIKDGTKSPGRDKIILLCLAAGLDDDETRRAFEAASVPSWYSKDKRDAVIRFCLCHHKSVIDTNILLEEYGFDPLASHWHTIHE